MAVITISRQYGCGGEYVAERVADMLKYRLFNKELIKFAAILTGTDEEKVKMFDEEEHSSFRSMLSKYFDANMFSDLFSKTDYSPHSLREMMNAEYETFFDSKSQHQEGITDAEAFQEMMRRIINKAADEMDAVVLGRGGVCILENNPSALHFRLVATMDDRVKWVGMREEMSEKEAYERIKEIDNRKRKYFKHHFDRSIDDHWMYHGILNLSKLDIQEASLAIANIAKTKFKM